ncbi:hypothetical protein [Patulibacter defluvii]|uniref:hypothetical protein n=1 Tax=Patulibacter defluvii TaxID=3095358 RepID=UPI002A750C08|nr:hypothetical protein [Patulibacter sp. DM4]
MTRIPQFERLSRRVVAPLAVGALVLGGGAVALASSGGEPAPPDRSLPGAVADTLDAPAPAGVTADVRFTSRLIDESVRGRAGGPLLDGASGTVRVGRDWRFAADLRSGDDRVQAAFDGRRLTVYDHRGRTAYTATAPAGTDQLLSMLGAFRASPQMIEMALSAARRFVDVSGPTPGRVGGRPAYTVRVAPKHDGGLLGAIELAWDPKTGVPLRLAVTAHGERQPVLELAASDVRVAPVADEQLRLDVPDGARSVRIDELARHRGAGAGSAEARKRAERALGDVLGEDGPDLSKLLTGGDGRRGASGVAAVRKAVPFPLAAPNQLAGLPRKAVRELRIGDRSGAALVYGEGLGALVVLETGAGDHPFDLARTGLRLPELAIDGAAGRELATPLGTVVSVRRGGVSYLIAGSLPTAAAEAAARQLVAR